MFFTRGIDVRKRIYTTIKMLPLTAVIALMILAWFAASDKTFNSYQAENGCILEPTSVAEYSDGSRSYRFNITNVTHTTHSLMFYTNHQEVYATVGGKLVYSNEKGNTIFGHTTGSVWNRIETPAYSSQVVVITKPVYQDIPSRPTEFLFGDGVAMYEKLIYSSFLEMLFCLLIITGGVCLVGYYFISGKSSKEILYLGVFAGILGVWSLGETAGAILLVQSRVAASYCAFTFLMLTGYPFVLFIRYFLHLHNAKVCDAVLIAMAIITVCCQAMQFMGIRDIKQNAVLVQLGLVLCCAYLVYGIIRNLRLGKHKRKTYICLLGGLVLGTAFAMDLNAYYGDQLNSNRYSKFGFLVFIILIGMETARYASQQAEKERKLKFYQEMAVKDLLTNCYNRNAYNKDVEEFSKEKNTFILTFDLNNLKKCNDTLGHSVGDQYIIESSTIIQNIFSSVGKVYRIGGDEFCVIAKNTSKEKLMLLTEKMRQEERDFNLESQLPLAIACGVAQYNPKEDNSLEDTRIRADELMYKNKKELKKIDTNRRILRQV